jgi:hypothetical protein
MNNREKLLQVFKSTYNKEYYEKLQQNFDAIFDNLDYEANYKENLKDLLYKECNYLIQNSISSDIKDLEKHSLEGNNTEIENNRKNIKIYESINLKNVLFSTPNLILYYENSKIYMYKNNGFKGPIVELIDNYKVFLQQQYIYFKEQNSVQFDNDIVSFALFQINEGIEFTTSLFGKELWVEYTGFEMFLEKFILFQKNQILASTPKLVNELKNYIFDDNEINWIPNEPFSKLLENHEGLIYEKNADYLLKFVKLDSFLNTKRKSLINIHKEVINTKDEDFIFKTIPVLIKQIEYYNQLLLLSINMIVALKKNKMILFFKIYETFDQIGIFDSNWEKLILNKMDELNMSIKNLVNQIQEMEIRLHQKIEDLGFEIQSSIDQMKENVIDEVSSIKNLDNGSASSILSLINTFQLIGISNKLK